jgi:hypothetical protein
MATYNKFHSFGKNVHEGKHNLSTAVLRVAFTNTAPSPTNQTIADIAQIATGGGYNTGGFTLPVVSSTQTSGTYKLVVQDVTFTATGTCGPFRYVVVYDSSSAGELLIGWYDYGDSLTLASGESLFLDFSDPGGLFTHQ